jgi:hypothetical protein
VHYLVDEIKAYRVVDGFPRLVRSQIPVPVQRASYVVDVSQCSKFETELDGI